MLGRIYHSTDKDEEAIKLYKKVIQVNPDFYSAYNDLGTSYETLGNQEENLRAQQALMDVYPRYLSQNPDDARAHIFYAHALVRLGKITGAEKEAEKALELSPNDALMSYNVACLHGRMGNKDLSLKYLNQAIKSGYANYEWIKRDPDLNAIKNEPEYMELMKEK